jgi:hypothetical protein
MKKIFLPLFLIGIFICPYAQTAKQLIITPGVGIGALKLGMSEQEAASLLQGELNWLGYKNEMCSFAGQVNEVDTVVQFVAGFDSCAKYANDLSKVMPVYSLYFKNHRLNYITVTTYGADEDLVKTVVLDNGVKFYDAMPDCMEKFGNDYLPIAWDGYDGDHIYYEKGMEVTYDAGRLTVVGIFPPMKNFRQLMTEHSTRLRAEFAGCKEAAKEE